MYGRVPVPAVAPRGSVLTRAARADLYGDAFNESVLMRPGPVAHPAVGFLRQPRRGRPGERARRDDRRDVGADAQAAERLRALLRAVHAHRRRAARGRPSGGEALMNLVATVANSGTPWLTIAGGIPLLGAIVVAAAAASRLAKLTALVFSRGRPGLGDRDGHPVQHLGADVPVHRGVLLDPAVRRALRARRGRDRAGAHRHDRGADAGGDARLLARRGRAGASGRPRRTSR